MPISLHVAANVYQHNE